MTKECPNCKKRLSEDKFAENKWRKDGLQVYCRKCKKEFDHQYYIKNKERQLERNTRNKKKYREQIQSLKKKCAYCGETEKCCLEFHHKDGSEKEFEIAQSYCKYGMKKIMEEVAKCEVVCANCHRKIHAGVVTDK